MPELGVKPTDRFIKKHDITTGPPHCHKCGSEMKLLAENDHSWQFGCEPCQHAHIFSKPQSQAAAKFHVQQQRRSEFERILKAADAKPKKFFLGGSR